MAVDAITTAFAAHTAFLQRVGTTLGRDVVPYLTLIEEDVQRIFNKYRDRKKTPHNHKAISDAISLATKTHLKAYIVELRAEHKTIGGVEASFASDTLSNALINDELEPVAPSATQVYALAKVSPIKHGGTSNVTYDIMLSNYWRQWSAEVDGIVAAGFVSGTNTDEIAKSVFSQLRLEKSTTSKTVFSRAVRSAKAVAITGANHMANQARIAFGQENDDLITGYRLISVVDSRTSKQCRSLDLTFIPKNSPKLTPPLHRNCRTALVYEVDKRYSIDDDDSTRASSFSVDGKKDPKPIKSEDIYYKSMGKLKAADQDAILGKTLGKAFRKLDSPAEFANATIDGFGRPLRIADMIKKDNALGKILRAQKKTNR